MVRKNLIKSLSVVMATMLAIMTVACGKNTVTDTITNQVTQAATEKVLENAVTANNFMNSISEEYLKVMLIFAG